MDLLDRLVAAIDRRQRKVLRIREFSDDPGCIFRLGFAIARERIELADGTVVHPGDPLGVLHLWNEQMPRIPPSGPDLAWAKELYRALVHSLRLLARYVAANPDLRDVPAFGGDLALVYTTATIRMLRRVGFEVVDPAEPQGPAARLVDWASRLWVWFLRRAFNPQSAKGLWPRDLEHRQLWLSRRVLLARHGPQHG